MATLSALRADLQTRFQDKNGGFLSATPANLYINMACDDFQSDAQPCFREFGYYVTAYQFRYDLPSDYVHSRAMMWYQNGVGTPIDYLSPQEFKQEGYLWKRAPRSIPERYTIIDNDIYLGPAPSSSGNTKILLSGVTSSSTSLAFTSSSDFYQNAGIVLVGSEQIAYQYNNTTTNNLTLCLRGQGGTTAAIHNSCDTVYRCDLVMTYAYSHKYMSADSDTPEFSSRFHRMIVNYALYLAHKQSGNEEAAATALQIYQAEKVVAKREIRRQVRDVRNRKVSTPYS
jgi:hypothetical protein